MKHDPETSPAGGGKRKIFSSLWDALMWIGFGLLAGLALVVTDVSRAVSYLNDEPETCVNCHVMNPQYATWQHSSHANVAHCNDCHVPHDNIIHHYWFKALDGLKHSSVFSLRLEPQVIRLSEGAIPVVADNCRRCHLAQVEQVDLMPAHDGGRLCWDCHREVPHGSARSLSATPTQMRPQLPSVGKGFEEPRIGNRSPRAPEEKK